jgi:hypothetical protein
MAKNARTALLFKGEDFDRTDIRRAAQLRAKNRGRRGCPAMCEMAASIVPSAFRSSSASDFHRSAYAKRSSLLPVRFDLQ